MPEQTLPTIPEDEVLQHPPLQRNTPVIKSLYDRGPWRVHPLPQNMVFALLEKILGSYDEILRTLVLIQDESDIENLDSWHTKLTALSTKALKTVLYHHHFEFEAEGFEEVEEKCHRIMMLVDELVPSEMGDHGLLVIGGTFFEDLEVLVEAVNEVRGVVTEMVVLLLDK